MKQKTTKTIELVNFLQHLVNEKKLLIANQSIVLAVSGGQDSICLFFIFLQLKTQWNWDFSLLYCNHLWQKDSFYTMSHLFKLAYLLNVRIYLTITLQKIFTEQKARNWRFLTFQRITQFYLLNVIVTGHSKSDRIETGLFNIFRGSGTKGVTSLDWTKVVNKRCFFKLSQTQLKNLKNLYQIERNIDILYPWKKNKKQFCPPTELLLSLPPLTPPTNIIEDDVSPPRGQSEQNKKFINNKIKKQTSIKKNLLKSITLYRNINNNFLLFDSASKIAYLENKVLLILPPRRYFSILSVPLFLNIPKKNVSSKYHRPNTLFESVNRDLQKRVLGAGARKGMLKKIFSLAIKTKSDLYLTSPKAYKFSVYQSKRKAKNILQSKQNHLVLPSQTNCFSEELQSIRNQTPAYTKIFDKNHYLLHSPLANLLLTALHLQTFGITSLKKARLVQSEFASYFPPDIKDVKGLLLTLSSYTSERGVKVSNKKMMLVGDVKRGCQQQCPLRKEEDASTSKIKLKNCCPFEGSEKKEKFVSMKCQSVRSFKFVKVKKKEIENFPLYTTEYTLIRPFLSLARFDLKKLCTSWKIPLFPDQSNQKVKYQRNRIRKQLLPTLRFFFNPQIDTVLYQFIDIIKKEEEYINFITARIVKKVEQKQEKSVELETSLFGVLPIAVKRKVMKHFLDPIMKKSLTFFDVEKVLKQISITNIASCDKQIPSKDVRYQTAKSQKSFLKKQEKVNKKNFKHFFLSVSNLSLTSPHRLKFRNMKLTFLRSPSNVKKEMVKTGFAENLQTESLFIKGKLTEKHILRICFVSSLTSHIAKPSLPGIKDVKGGSKADLFFNIETTPSHTVTSPKVTSEGDISSSLQKDILFTVINKKKSIYKKYELMFFPKIGSLFLQSQRLFFIKNKQYL